MQHMPKTQFMFQKEKKYRVQPAPNPIAVGRLDHCSIFFWRRTALTMKAGVSSRSTEKREKEFI